MPPLTTASALQRTMVCQVSLALPQVRNENRFARSGTEVHEYLAECLVRYRKKRSLDFELPSTDGYTDQAKEMCELMDLSRLQTLQPSLNPEVAYSYNLKTGAVTILGVNIGRSYGKAGPYDITGTTDVEGLYDGISYVADYKTGFSPVPSPHDNAQLKFAALCSMKTRNTTKCLAEIIRVYPNGSFYTDGAIISMADLEDYEKSLKSIGWKAAKAHRGEGVPVESDGCKYCPAFANCPAKTTLAKKILDIDDPGAITDEQVARLGDRLVRAQEVLTHLQRRYDEYVENKGAEGLVHDDGTVTRVVYEEGAEKLKVDVTLDVLTSRIGGAAAAKALESSVTKKSVREALKPLAPRGQLSTWEREVIEEIRDKGGVEKGVRRKVVRE